MVTCPDPSELMPEAFLNSLARSIPSDTRDGASVSRRGHAEAAPEVAVQVALVGEAGQPGDVGGPLAVFQEPAGEIDPQRHLIGVRRDANHGTEAADELILARA